MSNKIDIRYIGGLRTVAVHSISGSNLTTDAPIDNNGKGETFSPTDLIATGLGSCMLTIMAISLNKHGKSLGDVEMSVKKYMSVSPRMISGLQVSIKFHSEFSYKEQKIIEKAARACPVHRSLNENIKIETDFIYLN